MKKSIIWNASRDEFQKICSDSETLADVIRYFGMTFASGTYKTIKRRIKSENIDISHMHMGLNHNKWAVGNRYRGRKAVQLENVLIENSTYLNRTVLKRRLFETEIWKEYKCAICGISEWLGNKLVLRLDHINGVSNDNRLENLRLVCPNCDSQLPTFCRGQTKKYKKS
jgi:hypothetical protein